MKMKERTAILIIVIAFVLILVGLICWARAEEEELDPIFVICQPDSYVTIRFSPKKANNECGRADAGDMFLTDWKKKNGFLHVYGHFEAGEGWIKACYLTIWEPTVYRDGVKTKVRVKQVNCRRSIGGKRRCWLKKGAEVTVYVESEEWCVTNYGYIKTKYLEEIPNEADGSAEESLRPGVSGTRETGRRCAGLYRGELAQLHATGNLVQLAKAVPAAEFLAVYRGKSNQSGRKEVERIESRQRKAA